MKQIFVLLEKNLGQAERIYPHCFVIPAIVPCYQKTLRLRPPVAAFFISWISKEGPQRFIDQSGETEANTKKGGETKSTADSDIC